MKRVVHATGTVARSDGNDTDCGATGDVDKLILATHESQVTCKRCLRIRARTRLGFAGQSGGR